MLCHSVTGTRDGTRHETSDNVAEHFFWEMLCYFVTGTCDWPYQIAHLKYIVHISHLAHIYSFGTHFTLVHTASSEMYFAMNLSSS